MELAGYVLVVGGALLIAIAAMLARRTSGSAAARGSRPDAAAHALHAAATALGGSYRPPGPDSGSAHAGTIGLRRTGCAVSVTVVGKGSSRRVRLRVLHYGAQETTELDGPGLAPTDLDPDALLAAIDAACARMVAKV